MVQDKPWRTLQDNAFADEYTHEDDGDLVFETDRLRLDISRHLNDYTLCGEQEKAENGKLRPDDVSVDPTPNQTLVDARSDGRVLLPLMESGTFNKIFDSRVKDDVAFQVLEHILMAEFNELGYDRRQRSDGYDRFENHIRSLEKELANRTMEKETYETIVNHVGRSYKPSDHPYQNPVLSTEERREVTIYGLDSTQQWLAHEADYRAKADIDSLTFDLTWQGEEEKPDTFEFRVFLHDTTSKREGIKPPVLREEAFYRNFPILSERRFLQRRSQDKNPVKKDPVYRALRDDFPFEAVNGDAEQSDEEWAAMLERRTMSRETYDALDRQVRRAKDFEVFGYD